MKRRRGGAKSLTSYSDQQDMAATYPDSAPRNFRRSSLQSTHSRLQPVVPLGVNTRSSSRAGSPSPSQAMSMTSVQTRSSANGTVPIGGPDIDSDRPAKRSRRSEPTSPVAGSSSASSQETIQDYPEKLNRSQEDAEHKQEFDMRPETEAEEPLENEPTDVAMESNERELEVGRLGELRAAIAPKRRGRRPKRFRAETPAESTFGTPVPGTPSNGNDGGTGVNTDQEQAKVIRRLPGRRRAPNPNTSIEADLRRQLTLKTAYRSVAKALKPILDEIAKRSVIQLEDDAEAHTQCSEYEEVSVELDRRLQKRLAEVEAVYRYETERLNKAQDQAKEYADMQFYAFVEALKDDHQVRALTQIMELGRAAEREVDDDLTEDEDGVVPPSYDKVSFGNPTGRMDKKFDSRSRFFMQAERLANRTVELLKIAKELDRNIEDHLSDLEEDPREVPTGLGAMDMSRREIAIPLLNMHTLVSATEDVEARQKKVKKQKPLPNEQADGLQALAQAFELRSNSMDYPIVHQNPAPATQAAPSVPELGPVQYQHLPPQLAEEVPIKSQYVVSPPRILPTIAEASPTAQMQHNVDMRPMVPPPMHDQGKYQDNRTHRSQMHISHILSGQDSETRKLENDRTDKIPDMTNQHGQSEWNRQHIGNTPADHLAAMRPSDLPYTAPPPIARPLSAGRQSMEVEASGNGADPYSTPRSYYPNEGNRIRVSESPYQTRYAEDEGRNTIVKLEDEEPNHLKRARPRAATTSAIPQDDGYPVTPSGQNIRYEPWAGQQSVQPNGREGYVSHPSLGQRSPPTMARPVDDGGREARRSSIAAPQQYASAQISSGPPPSPLPPPPSYYGPPPHPQYPPSSYSPAADPRYPPHHSPSKNDAPQWSPQAPQAPQQWSSPGYPPQREGHHHYPPPPPPPEFEGYSPTQTRARDAQYSGPPPIMPSQSWSGPPPPLPPLPPYYIERSQEQREHRPPYGPPSDHHPEHRNSRDYHPRDERDYRNDREYPRWQERDRLPTHEEHRGASPPPHHEPNYYVFHDPNARGRGGRPRGSPRGQSRRGYRDSYSPRETRDER